MTLTPFWAPCPLKIVSYILIITLFRKLKKVRELTGLCPTCEQYLTAETRLNWSVMAAFFPFAVLGGTVRRDACLTSVRILRHLYIYFLYISSKDLKLILRFCTKVYILNHLAIYLVKTLFEVNYLRYIIKVILLLYLEIILGSLLISFCFVSVFSALGL